MPKDVAKEYLLAPDSVCFSSQKILFCNAIQYLLLTILIISWLQRHIFTNKVKNYVYTFRLPVTTSFIRLFFKRVYASICLSTMEMA